MRFARRKASRYRPNTVAELRRDMARLRFVMDQITEIEAARLQRLEQTPAEGPHAMVRLLARVTGVGLETADMLVHEILSRKLRDRRGWHRARSKGRRRAGSLGIPIVETVICPAASDR